MSVFKVRFLDKEYQIKCPEDKIQELQDAAIFINEEIKKLINKNSISSSDILVVILLNLANNYISLKKNMVDSDKTLDMLRNLQLKIVDVLTEQVES